MKKIFLLLYALYASLSVAWAEGDPDSVKLTLQKLEALQKFADSVDKAMKYETSTVMLPGGIAKLNIPQGFKYLGAEQSKYVLHDVWGNPEDNSVLGMIFPEYGSPMGDSSYAFVITFEDMGYVKDNDANKMDYKEIMEQWQKDEPASNAERKRMGYAPIHMVGWAQAPFYDSKNKVLHWAKELKFGDQEANTLNYDVRVLGRRGILSLNAVASMDQLPMVKNDINQILAIPEFTEGNRYSDFKNDNTDKIAAYTVGGLVAGKVLLKIGFFAKFWKFILIGIAAIGAWVRRLFKGKKQDELAYEPTPPPPSRDTEIPS